MKTKNVLLALSLAVVAAPAAVFLASDADAACCVAYDYRDIQGREKNIIDTITTQIDSMNLAIMETIRLSTGQLSANNKEQIGASSNIANVQDDRNVVGRVEAEVARALQESQSAPSACVVITGATSGGALSNGSKDFLTRNVQEMLDINLGEPGTPAADGRDVYTTERMRTYCRLYATEGDVQSGLCQTPAPSEMRGAALNASTSLFYSPQGQSGMTYSPERAQATNAFIQTAFGARPLGPMLPDEATTPGGRERAARRQEVASMNTIAYDAANYVASFRAPQAGSEMASWIQAVGQNIAGYENETIANGQASFADYMDVTARNFFFNANQMTQTNGFNEASALKQLVLIESFRAYLDWESFRQGEKQTVTLAGILKILVDERADRLVN